MRRIEAWLRRLGAAGVLGIGVLFFCVPFYLSAILPAERELEAQRLAAERLRTRAPLHPFAADDRGESLRRFYALFPEVASLPDEVERLYSLAHSARLELEQGEYRLERQGDGLVSYRVTLPIHGTYPQIREFVGAVLKELPIVSLDALRFERKKSGETRLEAQVRLTVYFRPAAPSERTNP